MVTRCPACATVFRVTPQQLQAHQGQVRCGRCMAVFDGFGTLATLPDQQPEEQAAKVSASFADDGGSTTAGENASSARPPGPEKPSAIGSVMAAEPGAGLPAAEPADSTGASDTAVPTAEPAPPLDLDAPHEPEEQPHGKGRARGSHAWAAAAALMLLALAAQAAYAYRSELVANYPGLKPVFARLCDIAGCTVPLPQRPQLIVIEASDLQVEDPLRPGVIQLTATLRNHAGYEVGYPALDLVLTNTKQHALARRIFLPAEYLEKPGSETRGLAAHAEVTIRLVLDTGDLGAAGFRLALLPARP
jgi:predicted Zn finger-like uncharacterized protein